LAIFCSNILEHFRMKKSPKIAENLICEYCDYVCCKTSDFVKHLSTNKHKNRTKLNILEQKVAKSRQNFICKHCDKCYSARNSLWYHEQKCKSIENKNILTDTSHNMTEIDNNTIDKDNLLIQLLKQNSELMEIIKSGTTTNNINTNNSNNTNSHNNAFNLNFFLNETCKNAMNMTDFMESINLELHDLLDVGKVGYVEGISNIIIKKLKALDETVRPIHCTDKKREIFYVKDANIWEKEEEDMKKLRKLISKVSYKNEKLLFKYKAEHPGCNFSESKFSDEYSKLVIEAMGGAGDNDREKQDKIIRNISKVTTVSNKKM
jgi:hypothetical protein